MNDIPSNRLAECSTTELRRQANTLARSRFGTTITYSRKVFIPLTTWCRDACGYCTFADGPKRNRAPYLTLDEVLDIARRGVAAECHEALFTLGESPESRYPEAQRWLDENGFDSTVDYLASAALAVREQTGLLPHVNPGTLSQSGWAALQPVSVSAGAMIETSCDALPAHRGAPDKTFAQRLAMLEWTGELGIPFTTGLLVGIGDSENDRIKALRAIAAVHGRYGHVQEVIVQNFLPKSGTGMAKWPACGAEEHVRTIALARLILPASIHVQAPPNLSQDPIALIRSGVDDLGGISPVTPDHVNPERPWPHLDRLENQLSGHGFQLRGRLPLYPERACQPEKSFPQPSKRKAHALAGAVYSRTDSQGYARNDPGALPTVGGPLPCSERGNPNTAAGVEGARFVSVTGAGSELARPMWAAGAATPPCRRSVSADRATVAFRAAVAAVLSAPSWEYLDRRDVEALLTAVGGDLSYACAAADELRDEICGSEVTYVRNANINYTNVCTFGCTFCAFSKGSQAASRRGVAYDLSSEDFADRVGQAVSDGATEVCLQGGIHPDYDGDTYLQIAKQVADQAPDLHVHAFSALEVWEGATRSQVSLADYVLSLKAAGVKSIPGTAAEILHDDVRAEICPDKLTSAEWLQCHRAVHENGMFSTATIMFGHREQPQHVVEHLLQVAKLQCETQGFTEFVPLPFVHHGAPMFVKGRSRRGPTWSEVLALTATSRLVFKTSLPNIQVSWVKCGLDGARQLLEAGANDLGGTLLSESISRAAGAVHGQRVSVAELSTCLPPGRTLQQRRTDYSRL